MKLDTRYTKAATAILLVTVSGCGSGIGIADVELARPLPESSCLAIGFLGGRDAWDDESKGVRQLALELRSEGLSAQTFENRRRDVALQAVREALDRDRDGNVDTREANAVRLIVYGQSFGGAAVVKFSRQLHELDIPVALSVQVDSVGRNDAVIPKNVRSAANLYQTDGWFLDGEHPIRAEDPDATRVLGNWRFDYSEPPGSEISLAGVHIWKLAFRIPHTRMDRDPEVWTKVKELVVGTCDNG